MNQVIVGVRRVVGLVLLALVAAPVFLATDPAAAPNDLAEAMRTSGLEYWRYAWGLATPFWSLPVVAVAVLAMLFSRGWLTRVVGRGGEVLARPPSFLFALFTGILGAGLTVLVSQGAFDGRTILNDASVQLLQARYFAEGRLSAPLLAVPEFWSMQFMVHTPVGWVSQYPPAHAIWLAGGFLLGGPWVAMAGAMGILGIFAALSFERLLPERIAVARSAALLAAGSPLLLTLAGGYMNHATVAAFAALALYFALRADEGKIAWAVAAGGGVGFMVATRPVSGLLIGTAVTVGVWLSNEHLAGWRRRWLFKRVACWALGGIPFAAGFAWFNAHFFGSPLTLGYMAATGPSHGLGFHIDPWGREYSPLHALAYTSTELMGLGRELLGAPLPLAAFVGLFLLVARQLKRGERILAAWALLPILGSALYWHHDLVFGPRMLGETAPAWCAMFVLAVTGIVRMSRRIWLSEAMVVIVLAAVGYGAVAGGRDRVARVAARAAPVPEVPSSEPALVFVHELWPDRLGARLAARGMRLDQVRTMLTSFHPCDIEAAMAGLEPAEAEPKCRIEHESDHMGWLGLADYLWTGDPPGVGGSGVLWARDLGPETNARLIAEHPDRTPWLVLPDGEGNGDVVPYDVGLRTLWGDSAAALSGAPDDAAAGTVTAPSREVARMQNDTIPP